MFAKIGAKVAPTLTSRLTILYTLMTSLLAISMILLLYLILMKSLEEQYDEIMWLYANEIEEIYVKNGLEELEKTLLEPDESDPDSSEGFIRLISLDKKILASSEMGTWPDFPIVNTEVEKLKKEKYIFSTLEYSNRKTPVRTLYWKIDEHKFLQVGFSVQDDSYVITEFTVTVVVISFLVILVSAGIGYYLANRAMSGVLRVTATASSISKGELKARVSIENQPLEIQQLANTFNMMIERVESLIKELKSLSNNVAHDLRSPLTRIRGQAEVALRGETSLDEFKGMAQQVIEESGKLETMINTMLEIAALDSGLQTLNKTNVDLVELLTEAHDLFITLSEDKQQDFALDLPDAPIYLSGDVTKLQRMVANLIDNAIKFTPENGRIFIRLRQVHNLIELSIKDSGPGIAEKNRQKIFDPFFREDTSRSKTGNGLGLSYVKTIVAVHKGEITVRNNSEGGCEFLMKYPAVFRKPSKPNFPNSGAPGH